MEKKFIMMSLLIFLITGLSTSSFLLSDYLTEKITEKNHNTAQLNFALGQENEAALELALNTVPFHSEQWLIHATHLAKTQGEVAYQLGEYYQENLAKSIFWYKSAIRLNYHQASITLANLYFEQDNFSQSLAILNSLPTDSSKSLFIKVQTLKLSIAISQGDLAQIKEIIHQYGRQIHQSEQGKLLLADIQKYQVLYDKSQPMALNNFPLTCDNSIQLFATSIAHLNRLESLVAAFKSQSLNNAICFEQVRYMATTELTCNNEQEKAIRCNELNWQPWADTINSRYVGIMLPKGGANVHFGILYFDALDSVDVVAHEISHLLGFIDEYPLVEGHVKCRTEQLEVFAQNISVLKKRYHGEKAVVRSDVLKQLAWAKYINKNTPILQAVSDEADNQYWQLGTPTEFKNEIGLFRAQTCNNSPEQLNGDLVAFKATVPRTKLQYYALSFPPLYSALIKENVEQYRMPSFHYNIALAYFQQENIEQANYWLEKSASLEVQMSRRGKIRQGDF